ncbi:MAG: hypothetical protein EXR98_15885 [Gemmataceae bacterium]|nr:hypothetical protein [Gemmataceae bacterium]
MRRLTILLGAALLGCVLLPNALQAQVIVVQSGRPYAPPIIVTQPRYYSAPPVVTYGSSYSYSYYPPATTVYSAPRGGVTYSAPAGATYVVPATGVIETRTYYGYGIFRPRGYYSETRVFP